MQYAERMKRLGTETAFEVLQRIQSLPKERQENLISFSIGEPDFNTPEHIKLAGIKAIQENYTHYTPSAGIPELREAIANFVSKTKSSLFASGASSVWTAVALLSLATAAHQGWSANLFTTVSDMFPRKAVASVVGFGGMFGAIGGMFIATAAGFILEFTGSYFIMFLIAGSLYLIALFIINLLVPEIKEIEMVETAKPS